MDVPLILGSFKISGKLISNSLKSLLTAVRFMPLFSRDLPMLFVFILAISWKFSFKYMGVISAFCVIKGNPISTFALPKIRL